VLQGGRSSRRNGEKASDTRSPFSTTASCHNNCSEYSGKEKQYVNQYRVKCTWIPYSA
jgi:hypothetical protein